MFQKMPIGFKSHNSSLARWVCISGLIIFTVCLVLSSAEPEPEARRGRGRGRGKSENNVRGRGKQALFTEEKSDDLVLSDDSKRNAKFFSMFNIVQFRNGPCRSNSRLTGGGTGATTRNGTCYTSGQCGSRGGTSSGGCAAGFGVCCVFLISASGGNVRENCTYIRNPNFPNAYTDTTAVQYTINKCASNVCKLRLDFESFTTLGTGNTLEVQQDMAGNTISTGGTCLDTFDVTVNTGGQTIPTICGQNTGQHMYVDIGKLGSDTANLAFTFSGSSTIRQWEIKVSQIACMGECTKDFNPPEGCLQYHTGVTGRFTTFNFIPTNDNHLRNQDYAICIRQEEGFCCIEYTACADQNDPFSLDTLITMMAEQDSVCTLDFIGIAGSGGDCNTGGGNSLPNVVRNKYCGPFLNVQAMGANNIPICDCTQPFQVDIFTDGLDDTGIVGTPTPNTTPSRGVCLDYRQIPCT